MASLQENSYTYINTCQIAGVATQVASGACTLERIVCNVATLVTIGIIDGTSGSTVNVGKIYGNNNTGQTSAHYDYNIRLSTGLRIITSGGNGTGNIKPDITVVWRQ